MNSDRFGSVCLWVCVSYGFVIAAKVQGQAGSMCVGGWGLFLDELLGRRLGQNDTLRLPAPQLQQGKHGHTHFPTGLKKIGVRLCSLPVLPGIIPCRPSTVRINDHKPPRSSVFKAWMWNESGFLRLLMLYQQYFIVRKSSRVFWRKRSVKSSFGPELTHSLHSVALNYGLCAVKGLQLPLSSVCWS